MMKCRVCGRKYKTVKKWHMIQEKDKITLINTKCKECDNCGDTVISEKQFDKYLERISGKRKRRKRK